MATDGGGDRVVIAQDVLTRGHSTFFHWKLPCRPRNLFAERLVGVTSYGVIARTREIGIRVALGAAPTRLAGMLVAQSLRPVVIGLGVGLVVAFWSVRLIERFLFEVESLDPVTYLAVACWILVISTVA